MGCSCGEVECARDMQHCHRAHSEAQGNLKPLHRRTSQNPMSPPILRMGRMMLWLKMGFGLSLSRAMNQRCKDLTMGDFLSSESGRALSKKGF